MAGAFAAAASHTCCFAKVPHPVLDASCSRLPERPQRLTAGERHCAHGIQQEALAAWCDTAVFCKKAAAWRPHRVGAMRAGKEAGLEGEVAEAVLNARNVQVESALARRLDSVRAPFGLAGGRLKGARGCPSWLETRLTFLMA